MTSDRHSDFPFSYLAFMTHNTRTVPIIMQIISKFILSMEMDFSVIDPTKKSPLSIDTVVKSDHCVRCIQTTSFHKKVFQYVNTAINPFSMLLMSFMCFWRRLGQWFLVWRRNWWKCSGLKLKRDFTGAVLGIIDKFFKDYRLWMEFSGEIIFVHTKSRPF